MKKWLLLPLVIVLVSVAAIYIFIPSTLNLSAIAYTHCSPSAAYRVLSNEGAWDNWRRMAPHCTITKKMYNSLEIDVASSVEQPILSKFDLLPLSSDSLILHWQSSLPGGSDPFTRLLQYRKAVSLKKEMSSKLARIAGYLADTKNVYGYTIQRASTIDTLLVTTKTALSYYPLTPDIYRLIDALKNYTAMQGATQTGPPIMNVMQLDEHSFQLMVALPTDRRLPGNKDIFFRKMVPGAFMVGDVTGGDQSVVHALQQMHLYFDDYKKTSMAIPFAALITDRTKEPDTSRWRTRIYAPVY